MITSGEVYGREPLKMKSFAELICGKLVGDKGYISQNHFNKFFIGDIQLIARLKSNMRGGLRSIYDRILLRKQKELWRITLIDQRRDLEFNDGIWLSKKAFHAWLWFCRLPLC